MGERCSELEQLLVQVGDELTLADQAAILEHVRNCAVCRRDLRTCASLAGLLQDIRFPEPPQTPHISDMALAEFAIKGIHAHDAAETMAHLADCQHCREEFVRIRAAMEQLEEFGYPCCQPSDGADSRRWWPDAMRRAFSTRERILTVVTGSIALVFAILCFVAAIHYVLTIPMEGTVSTSAASMVIGPFAWLCHHDPRCLSAVLIMIAASLATGILAFRGLRYAMRPLEWPPHK